jgi:hypothetical protein
MRESGSGVTFTRDPDSPDSEIKVCLVTFSSVFRAKILFSGLIETYLFLRHRE